MIQAEWERNTERERESWRKIVINGDSVIFPKPEGTGPSCREEEERNVVCVYV